MGHDTKFLQERGFGVSGKRNIPDQATTNKLVDMMERAKIGTGKIVIASTGTVFDAQSPEVLSAPPEVQESMSNTSLYHQSFS